MAQEKRNTIVAAKDKAMKQAKKGFTLMEIIFVVVIIGAISGVTIPKILSNSQQTQLMSTVQSDAKTILTKASQWKANDPDSNSSFLNINASAFKDYLPSGMVVENGTDTKPADATVIDSSGYGKGLSYAVKGLSQNGIEIKTSFGGVISNKKERMKIGKQIGNLFAKLSGDKSKTKIANVSSEGTVTVDGLVP